MNPKQTRTQCRALVILALAISPQFGCRDTPTAPGSTSPIIASESINSPGDSGSPETIFLAPLGPRHHPRGILDTTLAPSVSICRLDGDECSAGIMARFSSGNDADSTTRISVDQQAYSFSWKTRSITADTAIAYRITATLGDTTIGFTDFKIVDDGYIPPPLDTARYAFVSARNVLRVRFQIFLPPVTLTVISEPGVTGDLVSQTYTVRRGDRVTYNFAADSGYRNLLVTLDQSPIAKRGRVLMNESHVLVASADREAAVLPGDEWILRDARALLQAADKPRSAQRLLTKLEAMTDTAGILERLRRVELTILQRPSDAAALPQLDAALTGHVLEAGSGTGDFEPGSGGGGGGGGIATTVLVPLKSPDVPTGALAAARTTAPETVTIAYVNGILTTPLGALFAAHHVALIARGTRWGAAVPYEVKLMYNRSAMANETSAEDRCVLELGIKGDWLGLNSLPGEVARCLGSTEPRALAILTDFLEVGTQYSNVLKRTISTRPVDVDSIAAFTSRLRDSGRHVVFVMHSQGNLMVQQALSLLAARGQYSQPRDSTCIGGVALASPTSHAWPISSRHLRGLVVKGDIILSLGGNSFPQVGTPMSDSALAERTGSVRARIAGLASAAALRWALRLHGAVESYLEPAVMRERVEAALVSSYRSCALGEVRVTPQALELRTGGTGAFQAALLDMDGNDLDGRRGLIWRAESQTDWQRAVRVADDGVVSARYVGGTSVTASTRSMRGIGGVAVAPAPLAVSVNEKLSAEWMVLFLSTSQTVPIPPFAIPETSWGGGPCSENAEFTSNGRTGSFSKQCRGDYNVWTEPFPNAFTYTGAFFETGSTSALFTVSSLTASLHGWIGGPEPTLDLLPGPTPLDRIVLTASDKFGHLLARGIGCARGCKGWPPEP